MQRTNNLQDQKLLRFLKIMFCKTNKLYHILGNLKKSMHNPNNTKEIAKMKNPVLCYCSALAMSQDISIWHTSV